MRYWAEKGTRTEYAVPSFRLLAGIGSAGAASPTVSVDSPVTMHSHETRTYLRFTSHVLRLRANHSQDHLPRLRLSLRRQARRGTKECDSKDRRRQNRLHFSKHTGDRRERFRSY